MSAETKRTAGTGPARLIIADDYELARAGLRAILAGQPDLEVVGEAGNGWEALALCRQLQPDLALLDVRMPELDGLAATRAIKREYPHTAVIVVTIYDNPDYLFQALKAGAAGYILKDATQRQILTVIRDVLRGAVRLNPDIAGRLLRQLTGASEKQDEQPPERLTAREYEVLRLVALGQTNAEIARSLKVGVGTVKIHVQHLIAKLGAANRTQAAVRAVELGLLTPEPHEHTPQSGSNA